MARLIARRSRSERLPPLAAAVSVGAESNQSLMEEIADIGGGEHFFAGENVEEYSAQLAEIFRRLGGTRPVQLIR